MNRHSIDLNGNLK